MQNFRIALFLITTSLYLLNACKKKDGVYPSVVIHSPSQGKLFNVPDTVDVIFDASDDCCIDAISARIVNENFIPVSVTVSVSSVSNPFSGTLSIPVVDKLLETGDYYVLISASDGVNTHLEYREISLVGVAKTRRNVFFSDYVQGDNSTVHKIDSLFQSIEIFTVPEMDVRKLCVNSLDDELTLVGHFSENLKTYSLTLGSVAWSDAAFLVNQTVRFQNLICYKNQIYCSMYDREVRGYSNGGSLIMNMLTGYYRPDRLFRNENYFVVGQELVGTSSQFLFVYYAGSNALRWLQQLPIEIMAICELEEDVVLVFGNDGAQARVFEVDLDNDTYWEPRQLPAGKILDAVKLANRSYAIAHENGLYSYTYSPNYLNNIRPSKIYQDIVYDVDRNVIVAATGSSLEELSVTGVQLNAFYRTDSIGSVDIFYTR